MTIARSLAARARRTMVIVVVLTLVPVLGTGRPAAGAPLDRTSVDLPCGSVSGPLMLDGRHDVTVRTVGGCGPAIVEGSTAVDGWSEVPGNPGLWRAGVADEPLHASRGGRMLERAHTARVAGDPWITVTDASASQVSLATIEPSCTGRDLSGATLRVRTSLYEIDEGTVTAASTSGDGVTLQVRGFDGARGWGTYLEGPLCLLDDHTEWAWADGFLYVRETIVGTEPTGIRVSDGAAISARGARGLRISNVVVRDAVVGIDLTDTRRTRLRGVQVADTSSHSIDAGCAEHLVLTRSRLTRAGESGRHVGYCGRDITVTDSTLTEIGTVLMPRKSEAAIFGGFTDGMTIVGNTVARTQYIGIRVYAHAVVEGNTIRDACTILEDCGAIYLFGRERARLDTRIVGNDIRGVLGNEQGRDTTPGRWWIDGLSVAIYLDDNSANVRVAGNRLTDYQHGVLLHGAIDSTITRNRFGRAQGNHVMMNDDIRGRVMGGNLVRGNRFSSHAELVYDVFGVFGRDTELASYRDNHYPRLFPFAGIGDVGLVGIRRWRALVDDR